MSSEGQDSEGQDSEVEGADASEREAPAPTPARKRLRRRVADSRALFAVWVLVVTMVLVTVGFRSTAQVGPGEIQARFRPSLSGGTEMAVPPLGAIRAKTHAAPVMLRLELREVDLLDALGTDGSRGAGSTDPGDAASGDRSGAAALGAEALGEVETAVFADMGDAVQAVALRLLGAAALAGGLAALAHPGRRSWRRVLAGAALGPVGVAIVVAPAAIGFDPGRFERDPQFVGPLASAPELLQRVGSLETRFGSVQSRTEVLAERITGLYSTVTTAEIERSEGETVLLHVSDLHLNAVGLSLAQELATRFEVDAVVDTGDITSFGFEPEADFVELLAGFEVPYYVVPGNHDSRAVRQRLAESPSVRYLDGDVVEIAGVTVLGVGDPTVTALRSIPRDTIDRQYRAQFPLTRRLVRQHEPDLVLVHSPLQAEPVLGRVPAVGAGHLHRTTLEVVDGTVVAVVGSSGAAGLENLLVDEGEPHRFQLLRFVDGDLVAIDHVELSAQDGDFTLRRRLIGDDEADTSGAALTERVDEPSRDELDDEELDRVTSTTSSTTTTSTTTTSTTTTSSPTTTRP